MSDIIFPPPPETVHCPKCDRDVVVASNPGKPGIKSECKEHGCPIAADQSHQPTGDDGTLICFPDEEQRKPRKK
jgi:hypothetical protein